VILPFVPSFGFFGHFLGALHFLCHRFLWGRRGAGLLPLCPTFGAGRQTGKGVPP